MSNPPSDATHRARLIAFYLPQFYPIPENDRWWGPGFTEWTSVVEARPLFPGHRQPRIPADLGFYDLRVPETRVAQADLARAHGIEGFCYWHYWFGGERLLDRPFEEVLRSGQPDFGFCLGWANQPWTDTWLGTGRVLQEQRYSPDDDVAHGRWLAEAFADPRYLQIAGRPLLLVYRPTDLPDPGRTVDTFKAEATRAGLAEPFVLGIDAHALGRDFRADGLDGTVAFEPSLGVLPHNSAPTPLTRPWRKAARAVRNVSLGAWSTTAKVHSYRRFLARARRARERLDHPFYPTLVVGWDNTPRRGIGAYVLLDDDVRAFEGRLRELVEAAAAQDFDDRVIFVNAWNEWAEGNHLEPDLHDGLARLEAVRRVVMAES
ncbi:MAG: hypothetical protein AMXMBFR46_14830 [Acidimicrobiia bacterium]